VTEKGIVCNTKYNRFLRGVLRGVNYTGKEPHVSQGAVIQIHTKPSKPTTGYTFFGVKNLRNTIKIRGLGTKKDPSRGLFR
jgi:hypothetical protein